MILSWIELNISWVKDAAGVILTLVATVITVLTYRRARYTILQPLRSEVVKRQTDLLVELLGFLDGEEGNFYFEIDYMGIIACNAYQLLELCSFSLVDSTIGETINSEIGGFTFLKSSGEINSFVIPANPFHDINDEAEQEERLSQYKTKIKEQIAKHCLDDLELLYLTKRHVKAITRIEKYINNPFMPQQIQYHLRNILELVNKNIKGPIFNELKWFIIKINSLKPNKENPIQITPQAMYNNFLRYEISLTEELKKLTNTIREYLLIDKKWG